MQSFIKPDRGTLYKRAQGRYFPADSEKDGMFYYQLPLQGAPHGHILVSLRTHDRAEAAVRAQAITATCPDIAPLNLVEAISILLRVIQTRTKVPLPIPAGVLPREFSGSVPFYSPRPPTEADQKIAGSVPARIMGTDPAIYGDRPCQNSPGTVQIAQNPFNSLDSKTFSMGTDPEKYVVLPPYPRVPLADIWFLFTQKYQVAASSFGCYRQVLRNFRKWTSAEYADQVTREVAEQYTHYVFARKVSARTELNTLKRIWHTIWPDDFNPWNTGLRLLPKERTGVFRYRRLSLEEARAFHARLGYERDLRVRPDRGAIIRFRPGDADRRRVIDAGLYDDLYDALFFAWNYGMRVGSLASLKWEDFNLKLNMDFFLHVPPKTKGTKPWPLEIPYMPEIVNVLVSRMLRFKRPPTGWLFPSLHETYAYHQTKITSVVKRVMLAANVRDDHRGRASMHSFRASFITRMDEAGCPTGITDSITGHAPQTMHDLYSHSCVNIKRRWLVKAIPPLTVKKK